MFPYFSHQIRLCMVLHEENGSIQIIDRLTVCIFSNILFYCNNSEWNGRPWTCHLEVLRNDFDMQKKNYVINCYLSSCEQWLTIKSLKCWLTENDVIIWLCEFVSFYSDSMPFMQDKQIHIQIECVLFIHSYLALKKIIMQISHLTLLTITIQIYLFNGLFPCFAFKFTLKS